MMIASILLLSTVQVEPVVTVTRKGKPIAQAVVWLEGDAPSMRPVKATIQQKDKKFSPRITVVPVGSTVNFPNRDDVFHNVFAEYNAKKFDLGMYPKGQTREVKFDKPGLVSVLCNIHSEMNCYIWVIDSPAFGVSDKTGSVRLGKVPAGTYTLSAWHESGKKVSQKVEVTAGAKLTIAL